MTYKEYDTARMVLKLANRILANRNRSLVDVGITAEQADALEYIIRHEGSSIRDLQNCLGVRHQTAQGIVTRLKKKGLVVMNTSEQDGRCRSVVATDQGREKMELVEKNGSSTGQSMLNGMHKQEEEMFLELLTRAYENVSSEGT